MKVFTIKCNGGLRDEGGANFKSSYIKLLIEEEVDFTILNKAGDDVTTDFLLTFISKSETITRDLIDLIDRKVLLEIIAVGGIDNYKRRRK